MTVERLAHPTTAELEALTALWEAAVRATHHFLAPDDVGFYRRIVRCEALPAAALYVVRDDSRAFAAFAGIDRDRLDMLFVAPERRGTGLGRLLVRHAVERCGVRRVDVNEQNTAAAAFYRALGFRVEGRDGTDAAGRPYPILHLAR